MPLNDCAVCSNEDVYELSEVVLGVGLYVSAKLTTKGEHDECPTGC